MAAETPQEFGDEIRRERELREIPRQDLAAATKVSVRHIEAIEAGHLEILPAKVFARGFVRSIAIHLGLDPDRSVAAFSAVWDEWARAEAVRLEERLKTSGEFVRPRMARRRRRPTATSAALAVAAILAVATGVVVVGRPGQKVRNPFSRTLSTPLSATAPAAAVPLSLPPAIAADSVAVPSSVPITGAAPAPAAAFATSPGGSPAAAATPGAGEMRLTLTFLDDCWTEVKVDGQLAAAELFRKGTTREFVGARKFVLTLENARNVTVAVDGRPLGEFGAASGAAVVRNFVIDGAASRRPGTNG